MILRYNSNNSLTPGFKLALFEQEAICINLLHKDQDWRKIFDPVFG